jgi:hypothetical protein
VLCRVLARDPKPPMPLKERPEPPSPLPGLPLMEKRDRFEKETHSRINQALNAFTDAAKSHAEAMKSKAKADADFAAIVLDIFFGVAAPVFASYIMAGNGLLKRAAGKIAERLTLDRGDAEKTVRLISETDFLKEAFKGVGKVGSGVVKSNPVVLFGESEGDAFARHLRVTMHVGVQQITDHIADMTDTELVATWAAYDVEFTNEDVYAEALKQTFGAFEDLIEPIGKHIKTTQYGSTGGDVKAVWLTMYGMRRLAVVDFMWAPQGLGVDHWRRFKGWVPDELQQYAAAKSKHIYGEIEEIDPKSLDNTPADPGDRPKPERVLIDAGPEHRAPIRAYERRTPIGASEKRTPIATGGS